MNNKGMAISSILYTLLVLFLVLLFGILGLISSSNTAFNKLKEETYAKFNSGKPVILTTVDEADVNITVVSDVFITGYAITNTESIPTDWTDLSEQEQIEIKYKATKKGKYYIYIKDINNNIYSDTFNITAIACDYEINYAWTFDYTGSEQTFTVPCDGLYKLDVYGAQGGTIDSTAGGKGGYSSGYIVENVDTILYINVGQGGSKGGAATYNGGAAGIWNSSNSWGGASGGGATSIALVSGTINAIGYTSFVTNGNGLIVAGGGGGTGKYTYNGTYKGGAGGGTTGSKGSAGTSTAPTAGSQTAAGSDICVGSGTFGKANNASVPSAGGGGGLYGGGTASDHSGCATGGGAGGSGYIGGVPEITYNETTYSPATTSGVQSGNGKATITLIAY